MNAITKRSDTALVAMDEDRLIDVMRSSLYPGAKPESVSMVLAYCQARGLDPMRKPVHVVPMFVKGPDGRGGSMQDVVMPGIALYRIEASRTGEYAGKSEPVFGPAKTKTWAHRGYNGQEQQITATFPEWCKVTVTRRVGGQLCDFTALEFWVENYATAGKDSEAPNAMWAKRAYGQLAKVAEAQALRQAFPESTGGEATAEEMEGKTGEPRHVESTQVPPAKRPPLDDGLVAHVAQMQADKLPIVTPAGEQITVAKNRWLAAVTRAAAAMESIEAVRAWRAEMGPFLASISETEAALVEQAEAIITQRVDSFAEDVKGDAWEPTDA